MRRLLRVLTVLLWACCWPSHALAQAPAVESAKTLYAKGADHYEAGRLEEALKLFEQAHAQSPSWQTLNGIGLVHQDQGRQVEALNVYHELLASYAGELGSERLATLRQRIEQLEAQVGVLRVEAPQAGVEVLIDGAVVGTGAFRRSLFVTPGSHRVTARAEGYHTRELTIAVRPRDEHDVNLTLEAVEDPTLEPTPTPPPTPPAPAAAPAEVADSEPPGPRVWPFALMGGGALLAGGGGLLLSLANDDRDDYSRRVDAATEGATEPVRVDNGLEQRADRRQAWGVGLLIGGGALIIGGAGWWLFGGEESSPREQSFQLVFTGRSAHAVGRF